MLLYWKNIKPYTVLSHFPAFSQQSPRGEETVQEIIWDPGPFPRKTEADATTCLNLFSHLLCKTVVVLRVGSVSDIFLTLILSHKHCISHRKGSQWTLGEVNWIELNCNSLDFCWPCSVKIYFLLVAVWSWVYYLYHMKKDQLIFITHQRTGWKQSAPSFLAWVQSKWVIEPSILAESPSSFPSRLTRRDWL